MKFIFNSIKIPISYYISFIMYAIVFELLGLGSTTGTITFYIIYTVLLIFCGCFCNLKKHIYGLILLELQLIICPIIFSTNTQATVLNSFASLGNIMYSTFKPICSTVFNYEVGFINMLPDYIVSFIYPLVFIFIGNIIKKHKFKKRT